MTQADALNLSDDIEQNIDYFRSLNSIFNEIGRTDFGVLQSKRTLLKETLDVWSRLSPVANQQVGELAIILAAIELRSSESEDTSTATIRELLSTPDAYLAIANVYLPQVTADAIGELCFHRVGTTSFIFTVTKFSRILALKVVAPPYCFDSRIMQQTASYPQTYDRLFNETSIPVRAHESGDAYILMDFAEGQELSAYVADRLNADAGLLNRIGLAELVATRLLSCLVVMERLDVTHQDLNPKNVICRPTDAGDTTLRVIDFGRNYILSEGFGSAVRIQKAAEYVAPEVQGHSANTLNVSTDLYSIGRLLLDILKPQLGPGVSRGERLRALYQEAPSLGGVVEDLMSPEPAFRVAGAQAGDISTSTTSRLKAAFDIARKLQAPDGELSLTARQGIISTLMGNILQRLLQLRRIARSSEQTGRAKFLYYWAIVVFVVYTLSWFLFVFLTFRDLGMSWGPFSTSIATSKLKLPADSESYSNRLFGRAVILSFVIISCDYYMHIFSGLSFWSFADWRLRLTDVWIRFSAISCFPLALYIYLYRPQDWALLSAAGTLVIAITNALVYIACRRLLTAPTNFGEVGTTVEAGAGDLAEFFRPAEYGSWAALMAAYSIALLGVGLLLHIELARDVAVYAVLFITLNFFKIDASNCRSQAPKVRGNLARVISLGARAS